MAMNVSVQYNGGFLPDIILDPMLLRSGNPFKCHEEFFLSMQPMIPSTCFGLFLLDWGMLRRWSRWVQISL